MYIKTLVSFIFCLVTLVIMLPSNAAIHYCNKVCHPFYLGITGGYGTTTWGNLVPKDENAAITLSTPIQVNEGGTVWGIYGGYEFLPNFSLEGSYMRYPTATLYFDDLSLFTFYHNSTELTTRTESVSLVGKLMLIIPYMCGLRAYSSFGAAEVHRFDVIIDRWRLSPTFGAGFNYNFNNHVMMEFGTEYVAGYGQSELDPADHYIPFLYSGFLRLAYRF